MRDINNNQDTIDSRDVIERLDELESDREDAIEDGTLAEWTDENGEEYDSLRALVEDASGSPDWEYGETLIRDSYFRDYAQELAEDCGMIPEGLAWPCTCIDWDQAANELKMDYFCVDFDGVDYWIRA
jgi:hypothetical protein